MTREETRNAILIMEAYIDGYKIQSCGKQWNPRESLKPDWVNEELPSWNFEYFDYRLKPTPVLRPWTADEVPLGAWVLEKANNERRWLITDVHDREFRSDLLKLYEHSTDGGLTWKPCGVEEVGK